MPCLVKYFVAYGNCSQILVVTGLSERHLFTCTPSCRLDTVYSVCSQFFAESKTRTKNLIPLLLMRERVEESYLVGIEGE